MGIKRVLSDEVVSDASEAHAWGLLRDVITAELLECHLAPPAIPETKDSDAGAAINRKAAARADLIAKLAAAREAVLMHCQWVARARAPVAAF